MGPALQCRYQRLHTLGISVIPWCHGAVNTKQCHNLHQHQLAINYKTTHISHMRSITHANHIPITTYRQGSARTTVTGLISWCQHSKQRHYPINTISRSTTNQRASQVYTQSQIPHTLLTAKIQRGQLGQTLQHRYQRLHTLNIHIIPWYRCAINSK